MPYPTKLIPTTVVGSYPQPDWLVDRNVLTSRFVPRVHAHDMWRIADDELEAKQDEATRAAIRDMEEAGIDIITDGEIRRESYSNYFAPLAGGRRRPPRAPPRWWDGSRSMTKVPRVVGAIRRDAERWRCGMRSSCALATRTAPPR